MTANQSAHHVPAIYDAQPLAPELVATVRPMLVGQPDAAMLAAMLGLDGAE